MLLCVCFDRFLQRDLRRELASATRAGFLKFIFGGASVSVSVSVSVTFFWRRFDLVCVKKRNSRLCRKAVETRSSRSREFAPTVNCVSFCVKLGTIESRDLCLSNRETRLISSLLLGVCFLSSPRERELVSAPLSQNALAR